MFKYLMDKLQCEEMFLLLAMLFLLTCYQGDHLFSLNPKLSDKRNGKDDDNVRL